MHRNRSWFDGVSKRLDRDRRARRSVRVFRATVYRTHITGSACSGDDDAVGQKHSTRVASDVRWRGRRGGVLGPAQHSRGIAHNAKLCVRSSSPPLAGFRSISSVVRRVWFPATRLRHFFRLARHDAIDRWRGGPPHSPRATAGPLRAGTALPERLTRFDAAMRPDHWFLDERDASIFVREYPR